MLGSPHLLWVLALALAPLTAQAQGGAPGTLTGVVRDSTGAAITGVELSVAGAGTAFSDDTGTFRITAVPSGTVSIRVRRLGFQPTTLEFVLEPGATRSLSITIARLAQQLSAVVIRGTRRRPSGDFGGFYDRRERGFGHFITREQIERLHPTQVTDLMRMVPGVRLVPTRYMSDGVRLRGGGLNCPPQFWLDGTRLGEEYNMDFLDPAAVEGIEIYSVATVPPQFMPSPEKRTCGTIVVWTRRGERRQRAKRVTTAELAALVASTAVYTADQVDTAVRADSTKPVRPIYPDSLFHARVAGEAVVEFVVDTTGAVETETLGVVSSTHPLFTESVRRALLDAEFFPAMLRGRKVRQVVQQPYRFVLAESSDTKR